MNVRSSLQRGREKERKGKEMLTAADGGSAGFE